MSRSERSANRRPVVLVDANALFLPFVQGIDLQREVQRWHEGARLVVPASVRRELDRLERRGVPNARLARELANQFETRAAPGRGDDAILALARRERAAVVTADRGLRDRLADAGLTVLIPRERSRLAPFRRRARAAMVKNRPPLARRPVTRGPPDARR